MSSMWSALLAQRDNEAFVNHYVERNAAALFGSLSVPELARMPAEDQSSLLAMIAHYGSRSEALNWTFLLPLTRPGSGVPRHLQSIARSVLMARVGWGSLTPAQLREVCEALVLPVPPASVSAAVPPPVTGSVTAPSRLTAAGRTAALSCVSVLERTGDGSSSGGGEGRSMKAGAAEEAEGGDEAPKSVPAPDSSSSGSVGHKRKAEALADADAAADDDGKGGRVQRAFPDSGLVSPTVPHPHPPGELTPASAPSLLKHPTSSLESRFGVVLEECYAACAAIATTRGAGTLSRVQCTRVVDALVNTVRLTFPSGAAPYGRPRLAAALLVALDLFVLSDDQLASLVQHLQAFPRSDEVPGMCIPALLGSGCLLPRLRQSATAASRVLLKALQALCHVAPHAVVPFLLARLARSQATLEWLGTGTGTGSGTGSGGGCSASASAMQREALQRAARQAVSPVDLDRLLLLLCTEDCFKASARLIMEREGLSDPVPPQRWTHFLLSLEAFVGALPSPQGQGPRTGTSTGTGLTRAEQKDLLDYWAAAEAAASADELEKTPSERPYPWGADLVRVVGGIVCIVPKGGLSEETLRALLWRLDASLPSASSSSSESTAGGSGGGVGGAADLKKMGAAVALVVHGMATRFASQLGPLGAGAKSLMARCQSPLARKTAQLIDKHASGVT